MTTLCYFV